MIDPTAESPVELEIPGKAEFVGLVRLFVVALATSRRDIPDERVDDLKLAVSEAATNAIEAYSPGAGRVRVRWEEGPDFLAVTISDRGKGFDPSELPSCAPMIDSRRLSFERGLGIPIMRALADELTFSTSVDGTAARIVVRCKPAELIGFDPDGDQGELEDLELN